MSKTALFWILFLTVGLPFVLYNVVRDFIRWRREKRRSAGMPPFVSPAAPVVVPATLPKTCTAPGCTEPITSWAHDDHPGFCSDNCAAMAPKVGGESPPPRSSSSVTTPRGFPARTPDEDEQGEE